MAERRLGLDNPSFSGRLRHGHRSSSYVRRSVLASQSSVTNFDIKPSSSTQSVQPSTAVLPVHQPPAKQPESPRIERATGFEQLPPKRQNYAPVRPIQNEEYWQDQAANFSRQVRPSKAKVGSRRSIRLRDLIKLNHRSAALYGMAVVLFLIGGWVSLNGYRTNHLVAAQAKKLGQAGSSNSGDDDSAPSTVKPSSQAVANYAVAPDLPRYIDIGKLGVHARVLPMGIKSNGELRAPGNVYDAGWYNASAKPGQPGAMLIDGHISSWKTRGVFYGLNKLVKGDQITVQRGDGQKFTYVVVETKLFNRDNVDMPSLMVSKDTAKPGLNLISCSGDVIPGTNEFDKRLVVYAVMR